jgi:DNA-binding transcriptional ArsR family regulator
MVARHLATLARSGVLTANKQGRTVWYEAPSDLAARFRAIADAIDELAPADCCEEGDCCG